MKKDMNYTAPAIEVIELEMESDTAVMTHSADTSGAEEKTGGHFDSKKRDFWD